MNFYFNWQCFCLSKSDKLFYQSIIQRTLSSFENLVIDNDYVCFYIHSGQICAQFTINAIVNYEIPAFGNWLLYLFDMCHLKIANLIDPHNTKKCDMPHMNAVKDTMYSLVNKLVYHEQFNVASLIFEAIKKINTSYTYDHYVNQTNFLFFNFLLSWFHLATNITTYDVFLEIINNHFSIVAFQDCLAYQPLVQYQDDILHQNQNCHQIYFDFDHHLVNYKKTNLKDWFDNNMITNMINQIMNNTNFLQNIKKISNN